MDNGRPGIPGHRGPPVLAGPRRGAPVMGAARCPVAGVRAQAAPSLAAQPGSTQTSPPTPPPAESREDAELGLWSRGHRPGHGPGGRLWAKFCVATEGGVEKAKPRLVRLLSGRHSTPGERAPSPSALTDPLNLPGPHCPRPLASAGDPAPPPTPTPRCSRPSRPTAPLPDPRLGRSRRAPGRTSVLVIRCRPSFTTAKLPLPSVPSMS